MNDGSDKPPRAKIVIILDENKIIYAGFATSAQEQKIREVLKSTTIPQ